MEKGRGWGGGVVIKYDSIIISLCNNENLRSVFVRF